jgi:hypothetical protein
MPTEVTELRLPKLPPARREGDGQALFTVEDVWKRAKLTSNEAAGRRKPAADEHRRRGKENLRRRTLRTGPG